MGLVAQGQTTVRFETCLIGDSVTDTFSLHATTESGESTTLSPRRGRGRRIVRWSRDGDPFDARNVARLRVLAALFVLVPVGTQITAWLLEAAVETAPDVQVAVASPDWGILLLVALGLLALAQVFREGVALRDLDRTTI